MNDDPQPGRYRHYKGKEYLVQGVARHSETEEELVVYRPDYGDRRLWVRPKQMFLETVQVDDRAVPRFQRIAGQEHAVRHMIKNLLGDMPIPLGPGQLDPGQLGDEPCDHEPSTQERVEILAENEHVRIERIVSWGHVSPPDFWYDQEQAEWVTVLSGSARLRFQKDDDTVSLGPGDALLIPAGCRHRVDWTAPDEPTVWLAVFF